MGPHSQASGEFPLPVDEPTVAIHAHQAPRPFSPLQAAPSLHTATLERCF